MCRFTLEHSKLTNEYIINDSLHKIVFPTTASEKQAETCIEFLNNNIK